ncbi:MAG: acetolactate synthase small subunit [Anaerovoracaceae bacterium]|nr:acetolactate synthase small subunit [Bacillota bacterium]MDY5905827.1 acetolactate synthase small subunit [Anaerovoracaceae bacterium]
MKHVLSVLMENRTGVLRRISGLFGRRGYNIDSIVASATEDENLTRMTVVVEGDEYILDQVIKQLIKLHEIIDVENVTNADTLSRQLLLMKLRATHETRIDIIQLADAFGARIVDIKADSIIIEASAEDSVTQSIVDTFEPYGIISLMKTGTVALKK